MGTIIGIDLGTSTTEAAVYQDGQVIMLQNYLKEVVTPSAVGLDDGGNWVVGARARAQLLLSPENTAVEIKRKTGTGELINLGGRNYSPVELSAKLLNHVKTYASKALNEDVTRAVISVPAYFNDLQRKETILAGNLAGLQVERILNEPTAAAMSYGLEHMDEQSYVLVYDLGGGTFDVTLLEMFDGVLEVKASSGDNQLGGKDFDECLCAYLAAGFRQKTGINPEKDRAAMVRLKDEAERCKIRLSQENNCRVLLPMLMKKGDAPLDLDVTVTRETFEQLSKKLLERTHHPIDVVLQDSDLLPADIHRVILVGGSTRMPMVAKDIEQYLGIRPEGAVNPDYAVAEGAAIQAGIIEGKIHPEEGLIMTDVNPFSLGIRVCDDFTDDYMSVIIPRNTTIPVTRHERYETSYDGQRKARIDVYQGESDVASSNHFLGKFMLGGIPAARGGQEKLDVAFSYDLNGLLNVEATVLSNGRKASVQIDMLNQKGADTFGNGSERGAGEGDVSGWKKAALAPDYRALIRRAEREQKKLAIDGETKMEKDLADILYSLKAAILNNDNDSAEELKREVEDFIAFIE